MNPKQRLGQWGERRAEAYLAERGYAAVGRNVRTPYGELDLVVRKRDELVFVEVKTRTGRLYGFPEEAITPQKGIHLVESALHYLQLHPEYDGNWRIDVISIEVDRNTNEEWITWFENALSE